MIHEEVGKTSGVIPFIRVMDSLTLAISQGSLRRGSAAVYLPVWHPEIEEFIDMRRPKDAAERSTILAARRARRRRWRSRGRL